MDEPEVNQLSKSIDALLEQLTKANEILAPIEDEETKLNADEIQLRKAFEEQMRVIAEAKAAARQKKWQAQIAKVKIENEIALAKKKQQEEEAAAAKKKADEERLQREMAQYATLGKRFEDASIGLPWRERAKEHQLVAAKKIAVDRYVILADAMGLGKTLSSICLADMTEKATREANPEFPILGEEVEVYKPSRDVFTQKMVDAYKAKEWPFVNGPLEKMVVEIPSLTPFDDPVVKVRGFVLQPGNDIPYFGYDLQNKLRDQGFIEKVSNKVEKQIVNAIERPVGRKILYFCPAPLLRNVLEEWRNWSPHRSVTYIGNMSKAERNFALSFLPKLDEYVIIVNYEAWRRDKSLLEALSDCKFDTVIIDEAHSIKDMKSQAYKGVEQVILACKPEYIVPMTGTPILNKPQELFTLLHLVNPKEFHTEKDFLWKYCEEYYPKDIDGNESFTNPKWKFKEGGLEKLAAKISKNYLRRTKEQAGIVLPEKVIIHHDLDRDDENYPKQAEARENMKKFCTLVIKEKEKEGKAIQATAVIAMITRLRQIETWPAGVKGKYTYIDKNGDEQNEMVHLNVEESQKIDYIIRYDAESAEWEGLIPENIEDERMVVFSQFKAPLHEIKRRLELMGKKVVVIDGDTPDKVREEARHDFDRTKTPDRSQAKWDIALCNYKAAGVGLNLTAATNMVILDSEWNPGKAEQAYDRLHRIGQTENVTINVVNVKQTIDEWLEQLNKDKKNITDGLESAMVGAGDLLQAMESGLI